MMFLSGGPRFPSFGDRHGIRPIWHLFWSPRVPLTLRLQFLRQSADQSRRPRNTPHLLLSRHVVTSRQILSLHCSCGSAFQHLSAPSDCEC